MSSSVLDRVNDRLCDISMKYYDQSAFTYAYGNRGDWVCKVNKINIANKTRPTCGYSTTFVPDLEPISFHSMDTVPRAAGPDFDSPSLLQIPLTEYTIYEKIMPLSLVAQFVKNQTNFGSGQITLLHHACSSGCQWRIYRAISTGRQIFRRFCFFSMYSKL